MNTKLIYHKNEVLPWGVAIWIRFEDRWIEQARFMFSRDALAAQKHLAYGYIAAPPHRVNMVYLKREQSNA